MTPPFNHQNVVLIDIQMPFWSMVWFMVRWSLASIPAIIILVIIFAVVIAFLTTILGFGIAGLQMLSK